MKYLIKKLFLLFNKNTNHIGEGFLSNLPYTMENRNPLLWQ